MSQPSVLIVYNEPVLPADHPDAASEHDIIATSASIEEIFRSRGFPTRRIGFSTDPQPLLDAVRSSRPDVVFNLFEGLATHTETEIAVAAMLEWLRIPFTGSPSFGIALGRDKIRTKYLLQGARLPTADFLVVTSTPCPIWEYSWPAIVKPSCQDSSVGIEQGSVVTSQEQLEQRVLYVLKRYGGPVLVERFVYGREFHVNVFEEFLPAGELVRKLVPLAEIRFDYGQGQTYWPIYSYDAKWNTETEEYFGTPLDVPVYLPHDLTERIFEIAKQAFSLLGLRDYGRLDIRITDVGEIFILEANPNPYLNSIALIDGLQAMGRNHPDFIVNLARTALLRSQLKP